MKTIIKKLIPLNIKNRNGRIYTKEVVEEALVDFNDRIRKYGAVLGELNPKFETRNITELSEISHSVKKVWIKEEEIPKIDSMDDENWWDGPDPYEKKYSLWGEIDFLETPTGKIIQELSDENFDENFVFGLRGTGIVDDNGIVTNLHIISFDIVNKSDGAW